MTVVSLAALVLAGGASRRMGTTDKPLLLVGRHPMIAWVIHALAVTDMAISANGDPTRFSAFGLPVLDDGEFVGQGPLAGLLAGLDWAATIGAAVLLTAPGDTPFLPAGLAKSLSPAPCAVTDKGKRHHLIASWPVSARDILREMLTVSNRRSVGAFAERIGMRYRSIPKRSWDSFANINTPKDLEAARLWAGERSPRQLASPDQGLST